MYKRQGKRPAPSYDVLMKLRDALKLNDDEFGEMLDLAAESKNSRAVAYDLEMCIRDRYGADGCCRPSSGFKTERCTYDL